MTSFNEEDVTFKNIQVIWWWICFITILLFLIYYIADMMLFYPRESKFNVSIANYNISLNTLLLIA